MSASLLIASKELKQRVRDRSAFMLGILAPLGLAFIFSLILPDFSGAEFRIDTAVVDQDTSELSATFTDQVLGGVSESGLITVTELSDADELRTAVADGDYLAGWIIPSGFGEAVLSAQRAELLVVGNVDANVSRQIARSIAESYAADVSEAQLAGYVAASSQLADPIAAAAATQADTPVILLVDVSAESRELAGTTFFSAGMAVFFLFFTVQFGVASLIEERTIGTMPRLLSAPINSMSIVAGKGFASFVVGMVSMVALAIGTSVLVGAEWGDPLAVVILMSFGVLAALGIMAVVATLAKSPEQAANWQSIVAVVLGLLGGSFFPIAQGPGLLANLTLLTPHAWFLRGLGDLAAGGGVGSIGGPIAALAAFSVVTMGLAATRISGMVAP